MRGGAAGIATPHRSILENKHLLSSAREQIGGGDTRNPPADHTDVGPRILGERRGDPQAPCPHPQRVGVSSITEQRVLGRSANAQVAGLPSFFWITSACSRCACTMGFARSINSFSS